MMEVLRGGIESIDPGQAEAARSLARSGRLRRKVVFPGIKNAIPALTNELIINIWRFVGASVIGVFDLMYATTTVAGVHARWRSTAWRSWFT